MLPSQVKAYLNREWALARNLKHRYWAAHERTPEEALGIAEGLRQHARALRPDWPDDRQRQADLRAHTHVSECLRRVPKPVVA